MKVAFLGMVCLHQVFVDPVDAWVSLDRRKETLSRMPGLFTRAYAFPSKAVARWHFTRPTRLLKNLNDEDPRSPEEAGLMAKIEARSASIP